MFSINDTVLYGANGVCRITDICQKEFSGVIKDYYILTPLSNETMTIFVPVNNKLLTNRIKRILSEKMTGLLYYLLMNTHFITFMIIFIDIVDSFFESLFRFEF